MSANKLDKNIFLRDPLLGSLLTILDNVPFNARFVGDSLIQKKHLPAFTYAVNQWHTKDEATDKGTKEEYVYQDVLMALFKEKPDPKDCNYQWDGSYTSEKTKREVDVSFKYPFEKWKTETFNELKVIIDALTCKGGGEKEEVLNESGGRAGILTHTYLADIFGFEIVNKKVNYIYIHNEGDQGIYGVGAIFTLKSCFIDCCPKFAKSGILVAALKSQGFEFEDF